MNRSDELLDRRQAQIDRMLGRAPVASTFQPDEPLSPRGIDKPRASRRESGHGRPGFGPVPSASGYSTGLGARMGRSFSITSTGITGKPVGRPPLGQKMRVRVASPGTKAENKRTWAKVKKSRPREISEPLWHLLELRYGYGYKPWEIAEHIKPRVKARTISQGLNRAKKLAREAGINFK